MLARGNPLSRASEVPGGTVIGPIVEVQIVKNSWPTWTWNCNSITTWSGTHIYVMSSRRKSRFVDELHIANAVLRSSEEKLTSEKWRRKCLARRSQILASRSLVRPMFQVILAARNLVRTLSVLSPAKRPFSRREPFPRKQVEGHSCQWFVLRSSVSTGLQNGYKEWCAITVRWVTISTVLLKALAKQGARDFSEKSGFDLFTKGAARQQLSVVRIPNIPWHTFKDTLVEYQLTRRCWGILRFFTIGRYFFHRGCSFNIQLSLSWRTDWFMVDMRATKDGRLSFSLHTT